MIIKKNPEDFLNYLEDTSNIKGKATQLFLPENVEDVQKILKECFKNNTPLTCSAGHTGTTGGCVPFEGAILSLEKLNRVHQINIGEKTVVLDPGVTLKDLEFELNKRGLSFRAQPSESLAFIGGAVSTCASGTRGFRYGSIREYILGLDIVLGDGSFLKIKRGEFLADKRKFNCRICKKTINFSLPTYKMPKVKSQAGFFVEDNMDLIDLFIGSEGTLGVITRIKIKVQEISSGVFDGVIFFFNDDDALGFVDKIKKLKRENVFNPTSLEFLDNRSLDFLRKDYPQLSKNSYVVYFEQEFNQNEEKHLMDLWINAIESFKVDLGSVWFGESTLERNKIYEFRHKLPERINEFLRHYNQVKVATDISVPDKNFRIIYDLYKECAYDAKIEYVNFGHIGENHLHFNFLPKTDLEHEQAKTILLKLIEKALSLGGTVSAEHGIGKIKKKYLEMMYGKKHIFEMAKLKMFFDPHLILGRDNIFDSNILNEIKPECES